MTLERLPRAPVWSEIRGDGEPVRWQFTSPGYAVVAKVYPSSKLAGQFWYVSKGQAGEFSGYAPTLDGAKKVIEQFIKDNFRCK